MTSLFRTLRGATLASAMLCSAHLASAAALKIGPNGTTLQVSASPSLEARVPADIKSAGVLTIATDPSSPPYEYYAADGQTLIGADIDLGNAIAAKLGLNPKWSAIKFPGIIAALEAKRFDTALSGMGDTPAREQKLDFLDYSTDGNAIVVPKGPLSIKTIADLCGKHVAVLQGSVMQGLVEKPDKSCTSKMDIQVFQDVNQALLQVRTRRADATMYQYGVAVYIIKTARDAGGLQVLSFHQYGTGYNAMPFLKSNVALRDAVQAAITELKADGGYAAILGAWGMEANGLDKITVDDGLKYNQPSN